MINKFNKFLIILLLLLIIIIPTSFANDVDYNLTSVIDENQHEISLSSDDNEIIGDSGSVYFDASALSDGSGSQTSPYKTLNSGRLSGYTNYYFAPGVYTINSKPYSSGFSFSQSDMNFIGTDPENTIIQYTGSGNFFDTQSKLTFTGITLKGINIRTSASISATNTIFDSGIAEVEAEGNYYYENSYGGAIKISKSSSSSFYDDLWNIFNPGGSAQNDIKFDNCTFRNNYAAYGGALYIDGATVNITNSRFENNHAPNGGGAIHAINNAKLTIVGSTFSNDYSQFDGGGAVYVFNGTELLVKNTDFNNCNASLGSAIASLKSKTTLVNVTSRGNKASWIGGAVYAMYGTLSVRDSHFESNTAKNGGAIFSDNLTSLNIDSTKFINNQATGFGGAIVAYANTQTTVNNPTYSGNKASKDNDLYESQYYELFIGSDDYEMMQYQSSYEGVLPSKYDLRNYGYVTPLKDQFNSGNCWAFATIAALESCILKATGKQYILSEGNLKNLAQLYSDIGWNYETNCGGFYPMAFNYLTTWAGPVNATMDPTDDWDTLAPILNSVMHVQNILYLQRTSYTDNAKIKEAIMKYGAVATEIYISNTYLHSDGTYYCSENVDRNHAICVIGWDDTKVVSGAPGVGAWIVKNSYGDKWADKGYGYVSYYDKTLFRLNDAMYNSFTFILNDTVRFNKNYQYDFGQTDYFMTGDDTIWYQNVFTSTGNDYLAAFSTYFDAPTQWQANVYVGGVLKLTQSGKSEAGYYTINLKELIPLKAGDEFKIAIKISNPGGVAMFPIAEQTQYGLSHDGSRPGVSFFSKDGVNWIDLYNYKYTFNGTDEIMGHNYYSQAACLKAFTTEGVKEIINTLIDITAYSSESITVKVTDILGNNVNTGFVEFNVDGDVTTVEVTSGTALLNKYLSSGSHNVIATYLKNNYYNTSFVFKSIDLGREDLTIIINAGNITYNQDLDIDVIIKNMAGEIVDVPLNFYVDGAKKDLINNQLKISTLTIGNHTLKAETIQTTKYNSASVSKIINVGKLKSNLILEIKDTIAYGDLLNVKAILEGVSNAVVNVKVNNKNREIRILNGEGSIDIDDSFDISKYEVSAEFAGNDIYLASKTSKEFNVVKADFDLKADSVTVTEGETAAIKVYGLKNLLNYIDLEVDASFTKMVYDSYVEFEIANLDVNVYDFTVKLSESDYYNSNSAKGTITVLKKDVKFILNGENITKTVGDDKKFSVRLTDESLNPVIGATLTITIGNKTYSNKTDSNGLVYLDISNLSAGEYEVIIQYSNTQIKNKIVVLSNNQLIESIIANDMKRSLNSEVLFEARFYDINGNVLADKIVTFVINGNDYFVKTDEFGVARLNTNLGVGNYNVTVINPSTNDILVKNLEIVERITDNADVRFDYSYSGVYKLRLYGDNGQVVGAGEDVLVKLNSKSYYLKTDSNGFISLKISNLLPKTYTITAEYRRVAVSNKVVVKQILKAKNSKYKRYKMKKYTATLKTSAGKAIKGKKITFTIKGKTYTAKTNKKGVATIKIKQLTKVGKYKITIKYLKTSIVKTIQIKR